MLIGALRTRIPLVLLVMIMIYVAIFSVFTVERYNCYLTGGFDFGVFTQGFWTALHGKLFYETPDLPLMPSGSFFGVHFAPILFLLLPFYALYPSPVTLLVMQTIFIALGAIPIYLISKEVLKSDRKALVFAALYLSYPTIHSLNIFDFHVEALLPLFLLSSYYCYIKRKWPLYWVFAVLSFITIDFAPVIIAAMALSNILSEKEEVSKLINGKFRNLEKHTLMSIYSIIVSTIFFFTILQIGAFISGRPNWSVGGILSNFITPIWTIPSFTGYSYLLQFWLFQLSALIFLPLFAPVLLLMVAPWLLVDILNYSSITHYLLGYQHGGAFVAPLFFIAAIYGAKKVLKGNRGMWCTAIATMLLISVMITPLNPITENKMLGKAYEGYPRRTSHMDVLDEVIHLIPENASVYTINSLFPQLSNRDNVYIYLPEKSDIEYVLADMQSPWYNYQISIYSSNVKGNMAENLPNLMNTGDYGIVADADGVILLKRGYVGGILIFEKTSYVYNYRNLALKYGSEVPDTTSTSGNVLAHQPSDPIGVFWFGPYVSLLQGNYTVTFRLKAENINTDQLSTLQVTRKQGTVILGSLDVKGSDFKSELAWQNFTLSFEISQKEAIDFTVGSKENLEFRGIVSPSNSTVYLDYIEVSRIKERGYP